MLFTWLVDIQLGLKLGTALCLNYFSVRLSAIIRTTANNTVVYPISAVHILIVFTVHSLLA